MKNFQLYQFVGEKEKELEEKGNVTGKKKIKSNVKKRDTGEEDKTGSTEEPAQTASVN